MVFDQARTNPNGLALDDLTRRRTWAELADRCTRIAHLLRDGLGLRPNDHAAMLLGNRVEGVELTLGAVLAGVWITPINHHLQAEDHRRRPHRESLAMTRYRYLTCDVFTDRPFCGNPLAVLLDARGLTDAQMQSIAREFNYSETTFVLPGSAAARGAGAHFHAGW